MMLGLNIAEMQISKLAGTKLLHYLKP